MRKFVVGFLILVSITAISRHIQAMRPAAPYIPILTYHHIGDHIGRWYVNPQKFEQELAYLSEQQYHTISMEQYVDAMQVGAALPPHPIVLTFDDGYDDAYTNALPLLRKYGMIGTFFIATGHVGQTGYLTWEQIVAMRDEGIEFGAHMIAHAYLTMIAQTHAFIEILLSKLQLEFHLRQVIDIFAYPYNDHNSSIMSLARLSGFRGACIVTYHRGDHTNNIMEIPRVGILSGEAMNVFKMVVAHNVNVLR